MEFVFIFLPERKIYIFQNFHKIVKNENISFQRIREAIAKIFIKAGLRDIDASVLSELIMRDRSMSAQEIADNLRCSLSGVTGSLHRLMRLHLIVRRKEGKKYMYSSESNVLSILLRLLEDIYQHDLPRVRRLIEEEIKNIKGEEAKNIIELKRKIEKAEEYISSLIDIIKEYSEVI